MARTPSLLAPLVAATLTACANQQQRAPGASGAPGASVEPDRGPQASAPRRGRVANVGSRMAAPASRMQFRRHAIVDRQQGGLTVGTLAVPAGWNAESKVVWSYPEVSFPVRMSGRISSPDGTAWLEFFPSELFYWLEPHDVYTQIGGGTLGMVHRPGIGVQEAMQRYVIGRYRGRAQDLKVLGFRPIPNLAQALGKQPMPGDSLAARVTYTVNGRRVDEELFCHLTARERIPYHGPQGTTVESHRYLAYAFSMGAADGKLDGVKPLLGFLASSFQPDPVWERHRQQVQGFLNAEFNRMIAAGYQRIAAAGALSRSISANNDAMLASMQAQRASASRSADRANDDFSLYIRGTERMEDPYWGTSEQSYTSKYHWTDGQGTYQHSNDANFNPNIGDTTNWQLMQPAR